MISHVYIPADGLLRRDAMTRSIKRLVLVVLLAACGKTQMEPPVIIPPLPVGATKTSPASDTLRFTSNPDGFQPLSLNHGLRASTKAGEKTRIVLGAPASAEAAWVAVRAKGAANVTSGGNTFAVTADAPNVWALVPLKLGAVELTTDADVELSVRAGGYFEQSGAGLVVKREAAAEVKLTPGATPLAIPPASQTEPDDTWGTWLKVTATATSGDVRFELRGCGNEDPLEVVNVLAGQTRSTVVLAASGGLCAYASDALTVQVQPLARYRRFEKSTTRTVDKVTVLDTSAGIGFTGATLAGQKLELDLSKLGGFEGASAATLQLTGAALSAGACDGELSAAGGVFVHDVSKPLCLSSAEGGHVRAELLAVVKPGDAVPHSCPALPAAAACSAADLLGKLNCIDGVSATRRSPPPTDPNAEQYLLLVTQPTDHARPDGETFQQQVLLTFAGMGAPVVVHTTGYTLFSYRSDLGRHLNASELEVEHRFFGPSTPASRDFSKLDIVQSALDSHRIVELLRPVLGGKWLGTGHSKGGMTTLFHRRFFPCDVDGSVPYVTPLSYSLDDPRYGPFLQNIGGPRLQSCRQVFRDIDRGIIGGKASFAPQLRGSYTKIGGAEKALWELTGMMSWGLFQYGDVDDPDQGCPAYEALASSPGDFAQLVAYYAQAGEGYSDQAFAQAPNDELFGYTYQMTNELGGQGASRDHLADLGPVPSLQPVAPLSLGSVEVPQFEARAMLDVQVWLEAHGSRFLFIYGEIDPWSGGQLDLGGAIDSAKLFAPGTNHGARLDDLSTTDRLAAEEKLQRWVGSNGPRVGSGSLRPRSALDAQPQFRDVMKKLRL